MADPTAEADLTFNFTEASVLIVDENAGFMDVTTLMLSSFGFRKLHRCQSLGESHAFSQDVEADLILVDPFPRADEGLALIRDLRQRQQPSDPPLVVIVLTGHTPRELIQQARAMGADYVVAKPFSSSTLLDRILWSAAPATARARGGENPGGAGVQPQAVDPLREAARALLQ